MAGMEKRILAEDPLTKETDDAAGGNRGDGHCRGGGRPLKPKRE